MKLSKIVNKRVPQYTTKMDFSRPHPQTSIGIEVELEGMRLGHRTDQLKRWTVKKEGSLIHGIEFISDPVWGTAINDAIEELSDFLLVQKPYASFRTSTHIHLNVLDMEPEDLLHLIKLYIIYEPALFRLHKKWDRYDNIFCVPARKSLTIQDGYAELFRDLRRNTVRGSYVNYKYSAVNPNSIATLGTIEFRHMGGTLNPYGILPWIDILLQLKVAALLREDIFSPRDVFGSMLDDLEIREKDLEEGQDIIDYFNIVRVL